MSITYRSHLRRFRKETGLTQTDIATLLSMRSRSAVSKLERHQQSFSTSQLIMLCVVFDCTPSDLSPDLVTDIINTLEANAALLLFTNDSVKSSLKLRRKTALENIIKRCRYC